MASTRNGRRRTALVWPTATIICSAGLAVRAMLTGCDETTRSQVYQRIHDSLPPDRALEFAGRAMGKPANDFTEIVGGALYEYATAALTQRLRAEGVLPGLLDQLHLTLIQVGRYLANPDEMPVLGQVAVAAP